MREVNVDMNLGDVMEEGVT